MVLGGKAFARPGDRPGDAANRLAIRGPTAQERPVQFRQGRQVRSCCQRQRAGHRGLGRARLRGDPRSGAEDRLGICRPAGEEGRWRRRRRRARRQSLRQASVAHQAAAAAAAGWCYPDRKETMEMPGWIDRLGGLVERTAGLWVKLGGIESDANRAEIDAIPIDRPIYIAGLARSGTTILLELLAGHADVATHRYRDYPPVYTPLFWNRAFSQIYRGDATPGGAGAQGPDPGHPGQPRGDRGSVVDALLSWPPRSPGRPGAGRRDRQSGVRSVLPRPCAENPADPPGPALSRQGQLQRHPAGLSGETVP